MRNALGVNGITVSGTIASPYATISFGGSSAPVTGPVFINAPASPIPGGLILKSQGGNTVFTNNVKYGVIQITGSTSTSDFTGIDWQNSAGNVTGRIMVVNTGSGSSMDFGTSDNYALGITQIAFQLNNNSGVPGIAGYGPTAAGLVDLTPDTGTVTLTQTGGTTAPTVSATWARIGNLAMMQIPAFAAMTSNTASLTFTGLPAAIQPARTQIITLPPQAFIDAGAQLTAASTVAAELLAASGTITLLKNFSAAWTNTATSKGFNNVAITLWWPLN